MDPIRDREPGDTRILWGRVAALGGALLVAFLLGTWLGGGDGDIDQEQWDRLVSDLEDERRANEELNEYIDELSADGAQAEADEDSDGNGDGESDDDAAADEGDGQIYRVQSGDTLRSIAIEFYGDPDARERIVEANDLQQDATLQIDQELVIPPAE